MQNKMSWKLLLQEVSLLLLAQGFMSCIVTAEEPSLSCLFEHVDVYMSNASTCLGCFSFSCYRDHLVFKDENMTIAKCVNECEKRGFHYAGLAHSDMCSCGELECKKSGSGPPRFCGLPCSGNRANLCGGLYFISVYSVNNERMTEDISVENTSDATTDAMSLSLAVVLLFVLLLLFMISYKWFKSRGGQGDVANRDGTVVQHTDVRFTINTCRALHRAPIGAPSRARKALCYSGTPPQPSGNPRAVITSSFPFQDADDEYEERKSISVVDESFGIYSTSWSSSDTEETNSITMAPLRRNEGTYQNYPDMVTGFSYI
ncbi:uncharacterized protein [Diadema setosum]|uniref:uncharacterized protein n=1 Tax=Diadema setosum TaxID=31175 RepID=UPI003B3B80FA